MDSHASTDANWIVVCQQLFDSALPTGGYAHSHGLEGLVQMGEVKDSRSLLDFINNEVSDTLIHNDFPVFREAYAALESGSYSSLLEIDQLALALKPTYETRRAGAQIGRQTWRLYGQIFSHGTREQDQHARCSEFLSEQQAVVIYGLLSSILEIPLEAAMRAFAQQAVNNFAQACIKLLGFGPTEVQQVLFGFGARIPHWVKESHSISLAATGSMSPRWDIASGRHAYAERRLYIS